MLLEVPGDPVHDVRGTVVDRHGSPIVGVEVRVCHETGRSPSGRSWLSRADRATTDARGAFELRDCPRAHVFFAVAGEGIERVQILADAFVDGLRIQAARIMRLRVVGAPEEGLTFRLVDSKSETVTMRAEYPTFVSWQRDSSVEDRQHAPMIEVVDTAEHLVLERAGVEVRRIPLRWVPGQRLEIQL